MRKLRVCKHVYNKKIIPNNKYFFVFTFFNTNSTIVDFLKIILERSYNVHFFKLDAKNNLINFYFEFEIEDYFEEKEKLIELFSEENFKFCLTAIFNNYNYIEPIFFENIIFQEIYYVDIYSEIFFVIFIKIINLNAQNRKFIYLMNNIFLTNITFIKYKCLLSINPHLN